MKIQRTEDRRRKTEDREQRVEGKRILLKTFFSLCAISVICSRAGSPCYAAPDNGIRGQAGLGGMDKSVVMIRGAGQEFDFVTPWKPKAMSQGVGSGFIIEGNPFDSAQGKKVLTNAHNVSNNKYIELQKEGVAKRYPAKSGVHRA